MIHVQVTRVMTLGTAAITAALSAGVAQFHTDPEAANHSPPPRQVMEAQPVPLVPRLEVQQASGLVAVEQARQIVVLHPPGNQETASNTRGETAGQAPPLPTPTPPPPGAPAAPAAARPAAAPAPAPIDHPAGSVQDIIVKAFSPYGDAAVQWGLRVARCESGYNPRAVNPAGPYYGLFQFLMSTFRATPYGDRDIFDPTANANAAAWKWANGGASSWGCR